MHANAVGPIGMSELEWVVEVLETLEKRIAELEE